MSPSRTPNIEFIPDEWKASVLAILKRRRDDEIIWSITARQDWQVTDLYGFKDDAYEMLMPVLSQPLLLGRYHSDMLDRSDKSVCQTWAFLCPHPLGTPVPIYAKIGLHQRLVRINLISLHVDRTRDLERAIAEFAKKHLK